MSYLNFPRLAFAGEFQADVSTVNNDPRHFDNSTFEPYFQEFQHEKQYNGWWNPIGTGIFRLSECRVTSLLGPKGEEVGDLAFGCTIGNSTDRPSGKLVDLDPDWQMASCIFGLTVSLNDANGTVVMQGDYQPNPFRDLWMSRAPSSVPGDTRASAIFQSVLTNVRWNLDHIHSPFLQALKEATVDGMLSIRLTTYAYNMAKHEAARFSYGKVVGAIGPVYEDEPRSFILGRRFMPTTISNPPNGDAVSANRITCFSSQLDLDTNTLQADVSNALPIDAAFRIMDLGNLKFVVLKNPLITQGTPVSANDYIALGPLNCSQEAQDKFSGIQSLPVSEEAMALISDHPLALIQSNPSGNESVCLREAPDGLEVRAEQFAFRLDPNDPAANQLETTLYAAQYGSRIAAPELALTPQGEVSDEGNCPESVPASTTPKAPPQNNNVPAGAINWTMTSEGNGKVKIVFKGPSNFGVPRSYLDGQIYAINYNFAGAQQAVQQPLDCFAILVFSSFPVPSVPTWQDVRPILEQYAHLYPVMSKGLFDFSKQEVADANAHIMYFVFSNNNFDDPDYMPVTRDLSSAKRKMLTQYFKSVMETKLQVKDPQERFAARCPMGFGGKGAPHGHGG